MTTDIIIPDRRDLRRRRIKWAIWFALIWFVFLALVTSSGATQIHVLFFVAFTLAIYFVPTIVACHREHHQRFAIFVLNLVLGWTFLGWVGALIWACTAVRS
jgi:hypothetical protein